MINKKYLKSTLYENDPVTLNLENEVGRQTDADIEYFSTWIKNASITILFKQMNQHFNLICKSKKISILIKNTHKRKINQSDILKVNLVLVLPQKRRVLRILTRGGFGAGFGGPFWGFGFKNWLKFKCFVVEMIEIYQKYQNLKLKNPHDPTHPGYRRGPTR